MNIGDEALQGLVVQCSVMDHVKIEVRSIFLLHLLTSWRLRWECEVTISHM